jgi:hypothetical protein
MQPNGKHAVKSNVAEEGSPRLEMLANPELRGVFDISGALAILLTHLNINLE